MPLKAKVKNRGHRSHTTDDAIKEAVKEDTKNVLIRLTESKHKKFKIKATSNGQSFQEILETAVDNYLKD